MKDKKKIIALLAVLAMSVQIFCPVFAKDTDKIDVEPAKEQESRKVDTKGTYENLEYEITNEEVIITGYVTEPEGELVIPETIEGYPVTTIGNDAFYDCGFLTGVEMPKVQTIGYSAFLSCDILTNVEMPKVQTIDDYAFYFCESLTGVEMPEVQTIDEWAFAYCDSLTSVEIPKVQTTGVCAFYNCDSLTSVEMSNVQTIGDNAFSHCDSLTNIEMPEVQTIDGWAFYGCQSLTSVEMPKVQTIDNLAFYNCKSLTRVEMPNVKEVSGNSFVGSKWYNRLTDEFCIFGDGVLVKYCGTATDVTVPDNVKCVAGFYENKNVVSVIMPEVQTISYKAFYWCDSLTNVEMPKVQTIGDYAFWWCSSLTSVEMPKVQTIDDYAFYNCDSLTSVEMPEVQTIDERAFANCDSLTSVEMPRVQTIDNWAFSGCKSLTSIIISSDNENYSAEGGILYNKDKSTLVAYPSAANDIKIADNVQTIDNWAFSGCESLTSVEMPEVQTIGYSAFGGCESLASVEMPEVQTIGYSAFDGCKSLTSVEMPKVQTIDTLAFDDCESLTSVEMYDVQTINDYAFSGCYSLTGAYFYSDAPTSFGEYVFYECAQGFTIYYANGTQGWSTPTWNGYPAYPFNAVTGVTLDITEAELTIGETVQLTATVTPDDTINKNVTWTSSDENIATVDENGLVTAIAAGTVTITVTTDERGFTATCDVTVVDPIVSVTGVTLDVTEAELTIGETVRLTATVTPDDATNKNVTWTSSDESIATVDENGLVTAIAAGTVTITVTTNDGGFTATCEVTVKPDRSLGDVNGDGKINTADAVVILKAVAGMIQLDGIQSPAADVNHDGIVNTADAVVILKYVAGMITEF